MAPVAEKARLRVGELPLGPGQVHPRQWVTEPGPSNRALSQLTVVEASLYRDLVEGRYGPNVRLEQERVRFSCLRAALVPWGLSREVGRPACEPPTPHG